MTRTHLTTAALALSLALFSAPVHAQTPPPAPAVSADAMAALKRMGAYLRSLKAFQIEAATTNEAVLDDGQKNQSEGRVTFLVSMPDHLLINQSNDRVQRAFYYDGKTFTLSAERVGFYATVPAPPTVAQLADVLDDKYGIEVPLVDLFRWGAPAWSDAGIKAAVDLGPAVVGGITCDHYAFSQDDIDWQIWIQKGDFPLPRKLVITTKTDDARPQHTAAYTWNLAPSFNDGAFTFDPPAGAHRVVLAEISAAK